MPSEPSENYTLCQQACDYACAQILEGSTKLDGYVDLELHDRILALRYAPVSRSFLSSISPSIADFDRTISTCKESHIGNCDEYALMALHYLCKTKPSLAAELYEIKGNDHSFLIVGRPPHCNPLKPETWDDNVDAYVCDPWAKKVYLAKKYMEITENGKYQIKDDFNPTRQSLKPISEYTNITVLQSTTQANKLACDAFESVMNKYFAIYHKLENDLNKIASKLAKKYGTQDPNVGIIQDKIIELHVGIIQLKEDSDNYLKHKRSPEEKNDEYQSHLEKCKELQDKLKEQLHQLRQLTDIEMELEEEKSTVPNQEGSFSTMVDGFIQLKPEVLKAYQKAVQNSEKQTLSPKFIK